MNADAREDVDISDRSLTQFTSHGILSIRPKQIQPWYHLHFTFVGTCSSRLTMALLALSVPSTRFVSPSHTRKMAYDHRAILAELESRFRRLRDPSDRYRDAGT